MNSNNPMDVTIDNQQERIDFMEYLENEDYVVCQICKEKMKQITYKHLKKHNLTTKEYKEKFPNHMIRCTSSKIKHINNQNKTNLKKYGVKRPLQNKDIKNKADLTLKNNYGVNNAYCIDEVRKKSQLTCLQKYGAKTPFESILKDEIQLKVQSDISKNKRINSFKKICLKKYGVNHNWKNKECRNKILKTMMEKYGYTSVFKVEEIHAKACRNSFISNVEKRS